MMDYFSINGHANSLPLSVSVTPSLAITPLGLVIAIPRCKLPYQHQISRQGEFHYQSSIYLKIPKKMSPLIETAPPNTKECFDQSSLGDPKTPSQSQCQAQSQNQSECDCTEKKDVSNISAPTDPETGQQSRKGKPLSFYLAFIALLLMVFLVSLDATTLAVAIPVIQ